MGNETGENSNSDAVPAKAIETAVVPAVDVNTNKVQESDDDDVNPYVIETEPKSKIEPNIKDESESAVNNPEIRVNDTPERQDSTSSSSSDSSDDGQPNEKVEVKVVEAKSEIKPKSTAKKEVEPEAEVTAIKEPESK